MNQDFPLKLTSEQCKDRTFIVTGANTGIGLEVARYLITLGSSKVILAARNITQANSALAEIEKTSSITGVGEVWQLDLTSFDSVKKFAAKATKELSRLDGVIQNAGVGLDKWSTVEGHETSVTVNVLSTVLLDLLLLPSLKKTAKEHNTLTRLVVVGSSYPFSFESEVPGLKKGGLHSLDVELGANMDARYAVTKMVGMFATWQLAKILDVADSKVIINTVCPGLVKTSLTRHMKEEARNAIYEGYKKYGREPATGARVVLFAASTGPEGHGKFHQNCAIRQEDVPAWMTDSEAVELQERLWNEILGDLESTAPGAAKAAL